MNKIIKLNSKNYIDIQYKDQIKRDVILIYPGGGYEYTSERESYPVAKKYRQASYHSAIYFYREEKLIHPHLIHEVKEVISHLKKDPLINRIILIGFSAGGHFALHSLITYPNDFSAGILAYPVVSSDQDCIHEGSFENLIGHKDQTLFEKVSLEKLIKEKLPPIFIWHTKEDQAVPVENSYKLIKALESTKTNYELLLFEKGNHGLSLATREVTPKGMDQEQYFKDHKKVRTWFNRSVKFLRSQGL